MTTKRRRQQTLLRSFLETLGIVAAAAWLIWVGFILTEPCEDDVLRAEIWGCE